MKRYWILFRIKVLNTLYEVMAILSEVTTDAAHHFAYRAYRLSDRLALEEDAA